MNKLSRASFFLSLFIALIFPVKFAGADVGPTHYNGGTQKKATSTQRSKPQVTQQPVMPAPVKKQPVKKQVEPAAEEENKESKPWFDLGAIQEQLTRQSFQIHPRVRTDYTLDDNVLLEAKDEKMDSIFREVPGVSLTIPFLDHYFKADYEAAFEQFVKFPRENHIDQNLKSEVALNFTNMYIHADEQLSHTSSRSGTTLTDRVARLENKMDSVVGYKFNRFTLEGGYDYFIRDFDNAGFRSLNYSARTFHERVLMDLTSSGKTKVFVEHALTTYNYWKDASRDGMGNKYLAGITGDFFPKTTLYSKFGYEHIDYEHAGNADNFIAEVGALYKPLAKTAIDLGWISDTPQSTYSTTTYFKENKLFVRVRQGLTDKLSAESNFSYTRQRYEQDGTAGPGIFVNRKRNDDLITTDIKLIYQFNKWVSGDIKYQLNRRNSNASPFDYTDNLMTVGLASEI